MALDAFYVDSNVSLYPEAQPRHSGFLQVSGLHKLYVETYGNQEGVPVICIHGGPGAGGNASHARCFDLKHYYVIVYDQRGAKRSMPFGELEDNTTQDLISDIEQIRKHFNVEQWLVSGGSWGGALALAYGQSFPGQCLGFILRGTFLADKSAVAHIFTHARKQYPEYWDAMVAHIPVDERDDLLCAFTKRVMDPDPAVQMAAAKAFMLYDLSASTLVPNPELVEEIMSDSRVTLGVARLFTHYARNDFFLEEGELISKCNVIAHLPAYIVHGRHDGLCPVSNGYDLHKAWPGSKCHIAESTGHSFAEPGIQKGLVAASEALKRVLL